MTTSEQVNEIAAALAKAQAGMKNAALNKVNPHFRSKYADLAGIRDTVTKPLADNGIAVVQTVDPSGENGVYLRTRLLHTSGQWIEGACPILNVTDMQKMGSAITYARRYSLSAICGIAADEDDDGNEAAKSNGQAARPEPPKVTAPAGFDDWYSDLTATADEGTDALQKAWKGSQPFMRKHLLDTNTAGWEALKSRAAKAHKREAVSA
jgi:ERF superfamily protein